MSTLRHNGAAVPVRSENPVSAALKRLIIECITAGMGAREFNQLAKQGERKITAHRRQERIKELEALGVNTPVRYNATARVEADATYLGRSPERPGMVRISISTYKGGLTVDPLKVSPPKRR